MYIVILFCHTQYQATWVWIILWILLYDFACHYSVPNVFYMNTALTKPFCRMGSNKNPVSLIIGL